LENDDFSIVKLCSTCKKKSCCTNFAAPLVFTSDLKKLEEIQKTSDEFLKDVYIADHAVKQIKRKKGTTNCIFWDEKSGCTIYYQRPFDCQMFPFDIELINGEYWWIIYTCNQESDWRWTDNYLEILENNPLLRDNEKNLEIFAKSPLTKLEELPFTVLRKIKLAKECPVART